MKDCKLIVYHLGYKNVPENEYSMWVINMQILYGIS